MDVQRRPSFDYSIMHFKTSALFEMVRLILFRRFNALKQGSKPFSLLYVPLKDFDLTSHPCNIYSITSFQTFRKEFKFLICKENQTY